MIAGSALKDVSKLLSSSLFGKIFGVAALMLFTRILPKTEMAIFPAYLMLAGIPNLILSFGIYSTFLRDLPPLWRDHRAQAQGLIATGSAIIILGTIFPLLAAWHWSDLISWFVFKDMGKTWIIRIMIPGFFAYMLSKVAEYVMWGRGMFGATSFVQVLDSVVRPILSVAFYVYWGVFGLVLSLVVAQFLLAVVSIYLLRDTFRGSSPEWYSPRKLIAISMPFYVGNYLSYLRGDGDTLLVSSFLGPAALAEYYVAKTLYLNASLILTAVDKVAVERLARVARTRELLAVKVMELQDSIARVGVPAGLLAIALAPYGLILLAGSHYSGATWPAVALLIAWLIQFVAIPIDRTIFVAIPGYLRVSYSAVEACAVIGCAAALVPWAGLVGVAMARILAPLGSTLFGLGILRRNLGIRLSYGHISRIVLSAAPGTLAILLFGPHATNAKTAFLGCAAMTPLWICAYLVSAYFLDRQSLATLQLSVIRQYRAAFGR